MSLTHWLELLVASQLLLAIPALADSFAVSLGNFAFPS